MTRIVIHSRAGPDGVLHVDVPLGTSEADREFRVVIEDTTPPHLQHAVDEWLAFVDRTAGAWEGEFERPEQGQLEMRDELP